MPRRAQWLKPNVCKGDDQICSKVQTRLDQDSLDAYLLREQSLAVRLVLPREQQKLGYEYDWFQTHALCEPAVAR